MTEREAPCVEGTLHTRDGKGVVRLKGRYVTNIEDLWSAITEPERLARWFGDVEGDLRVGGEFRATVSRSGWDGRGRVDVCLPPKRLEVTMWEEDGAKHVVSVELIADGSETNLVLERRDVPPDLLWAFGSGWHEHLEDLGVHVRGRVVTDWSARGDTRFDELATTYRHMTVVPLEG